MLGHCLNFKAMRFESTCFNRIVSDKLHRVTLVLHAYDCRTVFFVFTLGHCVNFKTTRYEPTSFIGIVTDKFHCCVIMFQLGLSWNMTTTFLIAICRALEISLGVVTEPCYSSSTRHSLQVDDDNMNRILKKQQQILVQQLL